jgi:HAD superfamily hydrolase (TIGR01450 family)
MDAPAWLGGISHFVLDLDGVTWIGKRALPGIAELLALIRGSGRGVAFLSNNSTRNRESVVAKFDELGLGAKPGEIYTTNYIAGFFLREWAPDAKVVVIGSEQLADEVRKHGVNVLPWDTDEQADVVLMGLDFDTNYARLRAACLQIERGAALVGTNSDFTYPVDGGFLAPGNGSFVEMVAEVTGAVPKYLGKPEPFLIEALLRDAGVRPDQVLLLGDRLDTDIALARRTGLRSALVRSGVDAGADLEHVGANLQPDLDVKDAYELAALLRKVGFSATND